MSAPTDGLDQRPDLMAQHDGGVDAPAWRALALHPQYRPQLLKSGATWETVVAAEYTSERRERDRLWAIAVRAAHNAVAPSDEVRAGGVDVRVYVGYRVGDPGPWRGDDGLVRKVHLSFDDPEQDLSAARLAGFAGSMRRRSPENRPPTGITFCSRAATRGCPTKSGPGSKSRHHPPQASLAAQVEGGRLDGGIGSQRGWSALREARS